jgi:hypothetical protein
VEVFDHLFDGLERFLVLPGGVDDLAADLPEFPEVVMLGVPDLDAGTTVCVGSAIRLADLSPPSK